MARDGTNRGGARVGAGRKPKALFEKITEGKAEPLTLPEPAEIDGVDMPPVKDFMKASQKSGKDLCAEEVFKSTWLWLKARGCERLVKAGDIENRLVAFGLSAAFGVVYFLVFDSSAFPDEFRFSPWLIVLFTVAIYILQLPACMQVWKPLLKKVIEKKTQ